MGNASSSIVVNASPTTRSSSTPSAPPPSSDAVIDAIIKTLLCAGGGCDDKLKDMASACDFDRFDSKWLPSPSTDVGACAKAAAALRKCMASKAARYDVFVRDDMDKQQQQHGNSS